MKEKIVTSPYFDKPNDGGTKRKRIRVLKSEIEDDHNNSCPSIGDGNGNGTTKKTRRKRNNKKEVIVVSPYFAKCTEELEKKEQTFVDEIGGFDDSNSNGKQPLEIVLGLKSSNDVNLLKTKKEKVRVADGKELKVKQKKIVVSPYFNNKQQQQHVVLGLKSNNDVNLLKRKEEKDRVAAADSKALKVQEKKIVVSPYFDKQQQHVVLGLKSNNDVNLLSLERKEEKVRVAAADDIKKELNVKQKNIVENNPLNLEKEEKQDMIAGVENATKKRNIGDVKKPTTSQHNLVLKDDGYLPKKRTTPPANGMSFEDMLAKYTYKGNAQVEVKNEEQKLATGGIVKTGASETRLKQIKPLKPCQRVPKVSPYFHNKDEQEKKSKRKRKSTYLSAAEKRSEAYQKVTQDNKWRPPPYGLLQEDHAHDPWRVLVICMLLNCTTGDQVKKILPNFFALCPDAKAATEASTEEIKKVIQTAGLLKRAKDIRRMSKQYLRDEWTHAPQLHGIGKYGADAYAIFCTGKWDQVIPYDHKLTEYWQFLRRINQP